MSNKSLRKRIAEAKEHAMYLRLGGLDLNEIRDAIAEEFGFDRIQSTSIAAATLMGNDDEN